MLCQSNCPDLQEKYHSVIVPALAKLITDQGENLRVRIHSISCLLNFMKGLVNEEEDNEREESFGDSWLAKFDNDGNLKKKERDAWFQWTVQLPPVITVDSEDITHWFPNFLVCIY